MQIVIDHPGHYLIAQGEEPEVGVVYALEVAAEGTERQGRAWHALIQEYWCSGCHSYPAKSFMEFRDYIKRDLGAGFEKYIYADATGIHDAATIADIPPGTPRSLTRGRLKSFADYTKKERRESIDRLIAEMHQAGVQTKKFYLILEGLEGERA
jgi:hypothetical protein